MYRPPNIIILTTGTPQQFSEPPIYIYIYPVYAMLIQKNRFSSDFSGRWCLLESKNFRRPSLPRLACYINGLWTAFSLGLLEFSVFSVGFRVFWVCSLGFRGFWLCSLGFRV